MTRAGQQNGFVLLPVVLAIALIATIAFLVNTESTINVDMTASTTAAAEAEQVARAGLAHAEWGAQNSGCAGDMGMTTVPFGEAGSDNYTATVTTPGGGTTAHPNLAADQDAWFRSDNVTTNNGTNTTYHLRRESGNLEYAVVRFDLSSLPAGAQVNSAMASFYVKDGKGHPEGPVTVHRVTADWTETDATWESMGDQYDSAVLDTIPAQPDAGDAWVTVNLTAQVQAWVNGGQPNYGIMLIPTGEGTHAEYISREGTSGQQPRMDVIVGTGAASPATITATGTLTGNPSPANDISRTLARMAVPAYQPPGTVTLQLGTDPGEDAILDSFYDIRNYGGANYLQVHDNGSDWQQYPLIRFDLGRLPRGAAVRSAQLELRLQSLNAPGTATIHQVTHSWVEGTKSGTGIADGATWFTHDGANAWTAAGGDINALVVAETAIDGSETWVSWEIGPLVERWLAGEPNHGLQIRPDSALDQANFASKENTGDGVQPKLTIEYACECGSPCIAPQGKGNIVMVVVNPTTLVPADAYKKELFESWGYTVSVLSESANQSSYDSAVAAADVVYISESVNSTQVGSKLANAPIGVITEDGLYNDDLGISNNAGVTTGSAINITDTSHYITGIFPSGPLEIYDADMEQLVIFNGPAPDLQTLADVSGYSSLVTLEAGAALKGGATAAGRRAMLPLGRVANFNWDYLNHNGRLIVQRTLQWGTGNTGGPPQNLLFVSAGSTPTALEQLRIDLIESWGYSVNLIEEGDSQANFDAAIAANDVAYIPQSITAATLGTKLANASIGVVNEDGEQVEELGFSNDQLFKTNHEFDVVDNTHYITQPFATGFLTTLSSDQLVHMLNGTMAPGIQILGRTFNVGSQYEPSLAVLEAGGELWDGGNAAGRRVELPWGGGTFDFTALNTDGQTIMQRAIEWAEGADAGSTPESVLLVVADPGNLTAQETARKTLIEGWGYTVNPIDDNDTQVNFDTALAAADVAYVSLEVSATSLGTKLVDATIGVVSEHGDLIDDFGLASGSPTAVTLSNASIIDNGHYITDSFLLGGLTLASSSQPFTYVNAGVAAGVQTLADVFNKPALLVADSGAELLGSTPAPGRRVQLPWGSAGFDINALNTDGLKIMQRALEWAGTPSPVPAPVYDVLLIVGNLTLSSKDVGYKALIESWGHTVTLIDDGDSQANYDTAMDAADVILASGSALGSAMLDKATNTTKGLVNEVNGKIDNFGFSSSTSSTANFDTFSMTHATHYITEPFGGNPVTVFTTSLTNPVPGGTLAPDLAKVGFVSGTLALATLDTGATRYDSNPSPGRRAHLPFAAAETTDMTADGKTILQRALEWAAGAGSGGGGGGGDGGAAGPVFEELTDASNNGTSLIINKPPGTAAGDLLVAAVATDGNTATSLAPPAGWNVIHIADQGGAVTFGVWWKLAGASESGTYTFTWSGSEHAYGWIMRFTGHDPASPVDASSNDAGSGSAPSSPSVTTTVSDTLILRLGGFDDDDITTGNPGLSGHTAINMGDSGNGPTTASGGAGYVLQGSAGDSGTSAFSLTGSEEYVTVTIAIAPAP